ncbi:unnamed protein product [Nippostrongylus brasiliensis]|uniref:UDP-N-acetylglucosamine diphosphorylase n=1 Tax=Nippostrongylus brasiliensis TaxID=27835 RepID=A0A0N4XFI2_NIPBR|nr:unnamed protein product [Nippostrongylus brasiliensis]
MASYEVLLERVGSQKHLLNFWSELNDDEKAALVKQIDSIDFDTAREVFNASANIYTASPDNLTPVPNDHHVVFKNIPENERTHYWKKGLEAISRGEVAAIVLAGGQASRLGSSAPKGTIPLGLNISPCDSLLGIQASKIALLEKLGEREYPENKESSRIQWLVMTSQSTEQATREHLNKIIPAAGLSFDQVTIFSQAEIPAFDTDGNLLLSEKHKIVTAPTKEVVCT